MAERKQASINHQRPVVVGTVIIDGAGGVSLSPGAKGIASVALGAANNQIDVTFEESFSNNQYVGIADGLLASRLAHFLVNNPVSPGGLLGCEVFVSTIDATGAPVPVPDIRVTAGFFSIVVFPTA